MSLNSSLQPITIHGKGGANPPKILLICEELQIPYTVIDIPFSSLKEPSFLAINPNGRMPAIHDPNTDLTLWESGAIVLYLIERYDTDHKFSFARDSNEAQLARQWLFFQTTGQGPYYGQAVWFTKYHPEQLPSAQERYYREIERVTGVLESHLKSQPKEGDGPWLVGGKCSYADLAFVTWQVIAMRLLEGKADVSAFTEVKEWIEKMGKREAVRKALESLL
ncbi:glutathione s-transferase [Stagonosporopsis vannaccii]|nr:glutathione s-transferase [Stagonosporopsis vannaccii]